MKLNNFFFFSSNLDCNLINKYLSKHVYPKFLIRAAIKNSKFGYLDTFSEIYETIFKGSSKNFLSPLFQVGFSLAKKIFFYTNYNLLLFFEVAGKKNFVKNFTGALVARFNMWSNINHIIYVYGVSRGGFLGLSKGILGFLPKIYILRFNRNFILYKKYILFHYFSGLNLINYHFEPLFFLKNRIIHNFNKSSKKLRKVYFINLKYIFIQYTTLIQSWCKFFFDYICEIKSKNFAVLNLIFFKIISICL